MRNFTVRDVVCHELRSTTDEPAIGDSQTISLNGDYIYVADAVENILVEECIVDYAGASGMNEAGLRDKAVSASADRESVKWQRNMVGSAAIGFRQVNAGATKADGTTSSGRRTVIRNLIADSSSRHQLVSGDLASDEHYSNFNAYSVASLASDPADWAKRHITAGGTLAGWNALATGNDVYDDDSTYGEDLTLPALPAGGIEPVVINGAHMLLRQRVGL